MLTCNLLLHDIAHSSTEAHAVPQEPKYLKRHCQIQRKIQSNYRYSGEACLLMRALANQTARVAIT